MERIHSQLRILHVGKPSGDPVPVQMTSRNTVAVEVLSPQAVPLGAAISLHVEGGLILAEVSGCSRTDENEYALNLTIDQVIPSLSELQSLMNALLRAGGDRRASDARTRAGVDLH